MVTLVIEKNETLIVRGGDDGKSIVDVSGPDAPEGRHPPPPGAKAPGADAKSPPPEQNSKPAPKPEEAHKADDASEADGGAPRADGAPKPAGGTPAKTDSSDDNEEEKKPAAQKGWKRYSTTILGAVAVLVVCVIGFALWEFLRPEALPAGFASGNGRMEAVELDIAAKSPGRIMEMYADDGDSVTAGEIIVRMDTDILQAQLLQAHAEELEARNAANTAIATVVQRESEQTAAAALVTQRVAEQLVASQTVDRSRVLSGQHATSVQEFDNDVGKHSGAVAAVSSAQAQLAAARATSTAARSKVLEAKSKIDVSIASENRFQADIDDTKLKAARDGRVQYRVAQPGEVVAAGGKVLSMIDLNDVTMTFFLPEVSAGKIEIGAEVQIVLDAAPKSVIPAYVTFVANMAQFTPKTVETGIEREKLVFRVKARVSPETLKKHASAIKSGLPGIAYVRLDPAAVWPDVTKVRQTN